MDELVNMIYLQTIWMIYLPLYLGKVHDFNQVLYIIIYTITYGIIKTGRIAF